MMDDQQISNSTGERADGPTPVNGDANPITPASSRIPAGRTPSTSISENQALQSATLHLSSASGASLSTPSNLPDSSIPIQVPRAFIPQAGAPMEGPSVPTMPGAFNIAPVSLDSSTASAAPGRSVSSGVPLSRTMHSAPVGANHSPDTPIGPLDPATHYTFHRGVLSALTRMTVPGTSSSYPASSATSATLSGIMVPTEPRETIDQVVLRRWLLLLPTFLLLDTSTHPAPSGLLSWQLGLHSLISLMLALHAQDQLEWDTMNAASRALAECWSISLCWNGMEAAKGVVQSAGGRLKAVLDKDDPTRYKGRLLYPVEG